MELVQGNFKEKNEVGYSSTYRPKQRVSKKEKETDDWKIANVNYWISRCNSFTNALELDILYRAAAGKLDQRDYTYVTNQLNTQDPKLMGYPSKMRNIDIISGNLYTLLGELIERYFNPMVTALNADNKNKQYEEEYKIRVNHFQQEFVNELVKEGIAPEEIAQQQEPLDLKLKKVSNLKDQYAIIGQNSLNYILDFNSVDLIRRKTLYDFAVTSMMFTYRDVCNEDTQYEYCHPREMSFLASPNTNFIEDAQAVKREKLMTLGQIVDKFGQFEGFNDVLPELELAVESSTVANVPYYYGGEGDTMSLLGKLTGVKNNVLNSEAILVQHVQWTSMTKMLKVSGIDIMGKSYTIYVDEDYLVDKETEEVEQYWINQKYEGYRLADRYVIGVKPLDYQRGSYNNPSKCKNSYNGRIFMGNYITPQSIVEKGIVYQIKYNIIHYYLEMVLAKNMDKILLVPLGLIPNKEGWDEFTMMYYMKAFSILFVDESNSQSQMALQSIKTIDMSLGNYIQEVYGMLREIKNDWDESCGINQNRKGRGAASEGKAVNQERIYRGSVQSEEFFQEHEETIMKDLQCLLDLSKIAWQNGKKANFLSSDMKLVDLDIDPIIYQNIDLGVFVKNSGQAKRDLDLVKQEMGTIAQQTNQFQMLPRIAQATNMSKLIEEMDEMVAKVDKQTKAAEDAKNQLEKMKIDELQKDRDVLVYDIDKKFEVDQDKIDFSKEKNLLDNQTKLLIAEQTKDGNIDADNNNIPDVIELKRLQLEEGKLNKDKHEALSYINLERSKLQEQKAKRIQDKQIADKEIAAKIKIAKSKPKPKK